MGRTLAKRGQDFTKVWARLVQSLGKTSPKRGQDLGKVWARLRTAPMNFQQEKAEKKKQEKRKEKKILKPGSWELCGGRGRIHLRRRGAGRVLFLRGARAPRGLVQHSDGRAGAGIRVEPAAGKTVVAVGRGPDGLHLRPFAEKHRAEPHPCGAFFDGDFIVAAHAH